MSTDPLWGMYITLQPYQYAGNNPVGALDRGGDSIIVLQDWDGAGGLGHMAVLIGSDKEGWQLYSKNGGALGIAGESVKPDDGKPYATLADFKNDSEQNYNQGRFDDAYLIPTTAEEDTKAKAAASKAVKSNYFIFKTSCADVASDALEAAGKDPGSQPSEAGRIYGPHPVPNIRIHHIIKNNNATNQKSRAISNKRKNSPPKEDTKGDE